MQRRLEALVIIAVVLAGLWLGGAIRDWQDSQEVRAAHSGPELTSEEISSASALNERALTEDHLPNLLSRP